MHSNSSVPQSASSDDILLCIRSEFDTMSKSYKAIADYVMKNASFISGLSITQVARKVGTHTSTITRFCQSFGFSGFSEFKYLAEKNFIASIAHQYETYSNDSATIIKQKIASLQLSKLERTLQLLDISALELAANCIAAADSIALFAHGGSATTAKQGQILFMQIGLPAFYYSDPSTSVMAAARLKKGDIAIGISSSGYAKTAIDSLEIAHQRGVKTIGITGFSKSLIAQYSDILICHNSGIEDIRYMHISRLCETAVLGILQNIVLTKNHNNNDLALANSKNAFMSARYDEKK